MFLYADGHVADYTKKPIYEYGGEFESKMSPLSSADCVYIDSEYQVRQAFSNEYDRGNKEEPKLNLGECEVTSCSVNGDELFILDGAE